MPTQSPHFCVMPWYGHEVGPQARATSCCLLPERYNVAAFHQAMLQGRRPPECNKCWALEDQGVRSRRQQENEFLDYKLDRDIELIEQDVREQRSRPLLYQIMLSNLCNQACVTCNGAYSTKWIDLERKMRVSINKPYTVNIDSLNIDWTSARRIELLGGEPMFDPTLMMILTRLLDYDNTDCFISFVTNGSVSIDARTLAVMREFQDLNICVSIDGIGDRFEYLRWPGRWDVLLRNLDQYRDVSPNLSVSYTISSVNAMYYDETMAWFQQQGLQHNHNLVYKPAWASLARAPLVIKQHLGDHDFFRDLVTVTGEELAADRYVTALVAQDTVKKTDYRASLPELHQLLFAKS